MKIRTIQVLVVTCAFFAMSYGPYVQSAQDATTPGTMAQEQGSQKSLKGSKKGWRSNGKQSSNKRGYRSRWQKKNSTLTAEERAQCASMRENRKKERYQGEKWRDMTPQERADRKAKRIAEWQKLSPAEKEMRKKCFGDRNRGGFKGRSGNGQRRTCGKDVCARGQKRSSSSRSASSDQEEL